MRSDRENEKLSGIGAACLDWLVSDPTELERFMSLAGYSPQTLRAAVGSEALDAGLLDYLVSNEPALLAMCANSGLKVDDVMRVWHRRNGDF